MKKEERQLLLEKLMAQEIKKMRKVIKKYNRESLLYTPVKIFESKELDDTIAGRISKDDKEDKWIIEINSGYINDYYKDDISAWERRYHKNKLRHIVGHELTHAWVAENYNDFIDNAHRDSSIIFFNALEMFNYRSGHRCYTYWLCESSNVVKCSNKKEFDRYVIGLCKKLDMLEQAYKWQTMKFNKIDNIEVKLIFPYNDNVMGIEKFACVGSNAVGYNKEGVKTTYNSKYVTLSIGCMLRPRQARPVYREGVKDRYKRV